MRFSAEDLRNKGYIQTAGGEWVRAPRTGNLGAVQASKPKQDPIPPLELRKEAEKGSDARIEVSIIGHRSRMLDSGNFTASCKDILDGLVHARLIPDDSPKYIKESYDQVIDKEKAGLKIRIKYYDVGK